MTKGGTVGSCAIRFNFEDTSFCFMNLHLDGGHWEAQKRLQTLKECYHESFNKSGERGAANQKMHTVENHDVKVIFGDLNFRLQLHSQ